MYKFEQWKTFKDLGGTENETMEDYINLDYINKIIKDLSKTCSDLSNVILNEKHPIMQQLDTLLKSNSDKGKLKNAIKNKIIDDLSYKNIKTEYEDVLKNLIQ